MKKKAFTLTEVLIACAILSIFIGCLIALYTSSSKMSNTAMWLQNINNQLRIAARQLNSSINKASSPSAIFYPQKVVVSTNKCFYLKYYNGTLLSSATSTGMNFLVTTESVPAKTGSGVKTQPTEQDGDHDGTIYFHFFSINQKGELVYTRYIDTYKAEGFTKDFSKPIPSGKIEYKAVLVRDVESVNCVNKATGKERTPIEVTINCAMPKSQRTKRSEIAVGTPNTTSEATTSL